MRFSNLLQEPVKIAQAKLMYHLFFIIIVLLVARPKNIPIMKTIPTKDKVTNKKYLLDGELVT